MQMNESLPTVDQLAQRLRDLAAGARSKADLIASKSPTSTYTDPVDVLRTMAKEMERGLPPAPMTFEQITNYLGGRPLVSALWWYIENVDEDHPLRNQLFFYLRERVCDLNPKDEYQFTKALAKVEG
jgi:hypothetical protein